MLAQSKSLKGRLVGPTNSDGNHGEDVNEHYFYLDATPTLSYMKYIYKYPLRTLEGGKMAAFADKSGTLGGPRRGRCCFSGTLTCENRCIHRFIRSTLACG